MVLVLESGVQIRKFVNISIRTCYRSVCDHPFLVGLLLFLIFLYRSFPLLFSLWVSASPVLVCTAVLLGTLLSFGQPNIPEIEQEEKTTHDIASFRTGVSGDDTVVVGRDGNFSIETFSGETRDIVDTSAEEASSTDFRVNSNVEDRDGSVGYMPLVDENLQHTQNEERVIEDVERGVDSSELEDRRTIHEEKLGIESMARDVEAVEGQYSLFQKVHDESQVEDDIYSHQSVNAHKDDSLGGGCGDDDADDEEDDEASDSGSDGGESSSPDASMADILPILDELHPLLDLEASQPAHMSNDESDAASNRSIRSNDGSVESDEEIENHRGDVGEDEVDYNNCDGEETQDRKEDESKSAIKWTEDDQKNLMDLGNLELERNRRLENLIARRRARKSFKLTAEKNLIDLDSAELPFNVTPISTRRHNPFDLPYDSYDNMGLPPIPGSAPSIMQPRRNPFDLPYESNEEKPDLKGDHFEQEFITFHPKDTFFRRHESFNLGPSSLRDAKQERHDFKWRPVFLPERLDSEGTSYSSFQRQLSEISESKLSSVPDTESVSSAADLDERKFSEQDFAKEAEVISSIYRASVLVNHGIQSSEDVDSLEMGQPEKRDVQHDELEMKVGEVENLEPSLCGTGRLATPLEHITNDIHLIPEPVEEDNSSRSSLSSLSEVDEKVPDARKGESTGLEPRGDLIKEYVISPQPSLQESEVQVLSGMVDDNLNRGPVYDSSPSAAEKILSLNSISSDMQAEISEMVTPPASLEIPVPVVEQDSEVHGKSIEKGTSGSEEICGATSDVHAADEFHTGLGECDQLHFTCSHSEVDVDLAKNLDVKEASSDSSYQYVPSKEEPLSEQKKDQSWSDKSMVEPCIDDHNALDESDIAPSGSKEDLSIIKDMHVLELCEVQDPNLANSSSVASESTSIPSESPKYKTPVSEIELKDGILAGTLDEDQGQVSEHFDYHVEAVVTEENINEEVDDIKEIDEELLSELDTVGDFSVKEVVREPFLTELITEEANVASTEFGLLPKDSNLSESNHELPVLEAGLVNDIDLAFNQLHEGVDVEEVIFPSTVDNQLVVEASEHTLETSSQFSIVDARSLEDIFTALEQGSEGNVDEQPKTLDPKDGSEELPLKYIQTALKQLSEANVGELPKPSNSEDESEKVETNAVDSTNETATSNIGSDVQETITHAALKQVSEGNVDELPVPSNSKTGSAEIGIDAVCSSTKEMASSSIGYGAQETVTTHTALKPVPEGNVGELPEPNSNDGLAEVGTNAAGFTNEIASSNILSGVQETITHTSLEQVSEDNVGELPKQLSSKDGSTKGTNVVGSTAEIALSNTESGIQETLSTHTASNQVLEGNVGELPKPSYSNDGGV